MGAGSAIPSWAQQNARRHGEQDGSHGMGNIAQRRELQDRVILLSAEQDHEFLQMRGEDLMV